MKKLINILFLSIFLSSFALGAGNPTNSIGLVINSSQPLGIGLGGTGNTAGQAIPIGSALGDLSGTYPSPSIASNAITYAKFQQIVASSLFGNPTGSTANGQAINLGSTLNFSGTALQTIALSGDVTTLANSFATTIAPLAVTNSKIANSTIDLTAKVTGILPVANGGSGTSTAFASGNIVYAGSSGIYASNNNFTYDGSGIFILSSNTTTTQSIRALNSASSGTSQANFIVQRGNSGTTGSATQQFWTGATQNWQVGLFGGNSDYHIYDNIGLTDRLSISASTGNVKIPSITASSLVTTNGSNELVANNTLSSTVLGNIPVPTVTTFTGGASGNYTPPAGCTHFEVQAWGPGGGGGGVSAAASNAAAAAGGGSGAMFQDTVSAPFSAPYAYNVGTGGAGGAAGANPGSAGSGATTFGSFSAGAGTGGSSSTAGLTAAISSSGSGGTASGAADLIANGASGIHGLVLSGTVAFGGMGANAPQGGSGGRAALNGAGGNGSGPGAGGAGATSTNATSHAGGNGQDGKIIILEYYNG